VTSAAVEHYDGLNSQATRFEAAREHNRPSRLPPTNITPPDGSNTFQLATERPRITVVHAVSNSAGKTSLGEAAFSAPPCYTMRFAPLGPCSPPRKQR